MTAGARRAALRIAFEQRQAFLLPGAFNALSARMAEDLGFPAAYLSGAGLSNMGLALPDLGFLGLRDLAEETSRIRLATALPLLVDADTGFGNAVNVWQTVKVLEAAGADAIQIEDQVFPKRCGHFSGQRVAPLAEMLGKIRAAVDARGDSGLLLVARTDARSVDGFDAAVERARAFAEAGADILFVEALQGEEELRRLPALLPRPAILNLVLGGRTPVVSQQQAAAWGYGCVLYANAGLQGALRGMRAALTSLAGDGCLHEDPALVASFAERQALVDKSRFDALGARFAAQD